ncbi:GDSL esterase/lipase At1g06990-like [Coffea arabica]|uniref:GDSL esterase/lipase At1g06990-like n=1 Tax=Coffea arabica TaxID=13443 RepID=A0A6P6TBA1_COFAR|nr:GDSL esterase/lipase At1g06990-like [Coffea arabica]
MAIPSHFWNFLVQICFLILAFNYECNGQNIPRFSAIFAFGDSVLDTGNNDYLNSIARANYQPYGTNFPGKIATERFSDGKLVPDLLASLLGLKELVPPYLQPNLTDRELLTGNLQDYLKRLTNVVGRQEARRIVNQALVLLHAGAVDFLYHFDVSRTNRRIQFTVNNYQDFLLGKLQDFLKELYDLGCRRIIASNLPPLGCLPITMTVNSPIWGGCIEKINVDTRSYNDKLGNLLPQVQAKLPGIKLVYQDTYGLDLWKLDEDVAVLEFGTSCIPITPICGNASQYFFWDSIHPTEAACRIVAKEILNKLVESN